MSGGWRPALLPVMLVLLAWGWVVFSQPDRPLPDFDTVRAAHRSSDLLILDRAGEPLHELRRDLSARRLAWMPLDQMSPVLREVVVAAEDRRFWRHAGVDRLALWRAFGLWLRGRNGGGASTLTMQLAARLDPGLQPAATRRTPGQKWAQIRAAWALEAGWSKEQILEAYLNLVSFRGEVQGIHAASRGLFGKFPAGLEREEALLLAALIPSPNAAGGRVARRACTLARRLKEGEQVCPLLRQLAARVLLGGTPLVRPLEALAPHAARQLLADGVADAAPSGRVASTIDGALQRFALETLTQQLTQLADRNVRDGALLVVENATGEILAYVGNGGDHPATRHVDGVTAPRQAGSTLKPFLYQLALERRLLTAASLLEDTPLELAAVGGLYAPQNYDREFKGWVSARTALASSLNVPAVRTLLLVGSEIFLERLRRLGFTHLTRDAAHYGYALALGAGEVTLRELVLAYRILANGGLSSPISLRPGVEQPIPVRIMQPGAVAIIGHILADPLARGLTFGLDNPLTTPFWSAVKTGTSKQMRDNWCVGFSARYTVGVWVGNFDGAPMHEVSGITGAAPVWLELMRYLHRREGSPPPSLPPEVTATPITFEPPLEPPREELFLPGTTMTSVRRNDRHPARILHPPDGTILAVDPDIPPDRQRVFFRMGPHDPTLVWRLDGQLVVEVDGWFPVSGNHRLELLRPATGEQGEVVQEAVRFHVRGKTGPGR
ncbi:MAG: penicillin-binding protein 1C [Magnetococcales bacterium]|nr:penicillin-binding protein 1C [Magnetococcales bacterium]